MAESKTFDALLSAMQESVIEAQRMAEQQHVKQLERYFEKDGTPLCHTIKVPAPNHNPNDPNSPDTVDMEVPLFCLLPPSSLRIKEMKVKFKVKMEGELEARDSKDGEGVKIKMRKASPLGIDLGLGGLFSRSGNVAEVELTIDGDDPPDGFMKIANHLLRGM